MIPYLDLVAQHESIKNEIRDAVDTVLASGQYVLGPDLEAFEHELARWCGSDHAVAVSSGTSALQLALIAAGVGPGDEVVTVPMTFVATVAAARYLDARPVLVDVDGTTRNLDVSRLEDAIGPRTRAIVPVHLYGLMADMGPIVEIAARHGIPVIEDAAQALGATCHGQSAGSIGELGCFSFYPGKNLGACGEGGAVVTSSARLAERLRRLRDWGQDGRHHYVERGFNYRMDTLQAAILRVKLRHLADWTQARRAHAAGYDASLAGHGIELPIAPAGFEPVHHVYGVMLSNRDRIQASLAEQGIATGIHYPVPVHLTPAHADLGYGLGDFPEAERVAREELSLPLYPELAAPDRERVSEALLGVISTAAAA